MQAKQTKLTAGQARRAELFDPRARPEHKPKMS